MALAVSGAASGSVLNMSSGWLADTYTAIKNSQNAGGLIGMLDNARGDNSLKSYLKRTQAASNGFALIAQSGVANAGAFYSQLAQSGQQKLANERLEQAFKDLERTKNMVQKGNVLDPIIFFANGSTLDTNRNIHDPRGMIGEALGVDMHVVTADEAPLRRIANASMDKLAAFLTSPEVAPGTPGQASPENTLVALAQPAPSSPEAAGIFRIFRPHADPLALNDDERASPAAHNDETGGVPLPRRRPMPVAALPMTVAAAR